MCIHKGQLHTIPDEPTHCLPSWKSRECWMRFKSLSCSIPTASVRVERCMPTAEQQLPFWRPKSNMLDLICIQLTGRAVILLVQSRQWSHCELGSVAHVALLYGYAACVCTVSQGWTAPQKYCSSGPQCGNAFMRIRVAVIADIREQARLRAFKKAI